ncbi:MAG: MFS transporter [Gammaproteobacteria bacterium]
MTDSIGRTSHRLGPIRLAPGVRPRHALAYLFAAFISIGLFTYLTTLTPYLLEVNLGLPKDEQGTVSGNLQFWQEILALGVIGWWGAVSDRLGRRPVYVLGFILLALAYVLYPTAESVLELTAYRLVFGLALAALSAMLAAVLADYAHEDSRGKLTGLAFLLNGIGAVLFFVFLTRLPAFYAAPNIFSASGADALRAGHYAYWTIACLALLAAIVMLGLKPGPPVAVRKGATVVELLRDGLAAARNPRIAVSYVGAFAARADMAVISLFLALWIVQAATSASASPDEAVGRAGMITGMALVASMIWAPIFGLIADRIDRLTLLCIGFLLAAIGYGWVASLDDILAPAAIPALLCLGIGQSSTILSSSVLLAQEAEADIRGSVFGLQTLFGAVGILALSAGGGVLFDKLGPHAPVVAISAANGLVFLLAVVIRVREVRSDYRRRSRLSRSCAGRIQLLTGRRNSS